MGLTLGWHELWQRQGQGGGGMTWREEVGEQGEPSCGAVDARCRGDRGRSKDGDADVSVRISSEIIRTIELRNHSRLASATPSLTCRPKIWVKSLYNNVVARSFFKANIFFSKIDNIMRNNHSH